jgi:hypothetical protein
LYFVRSIGKSLTLDIGNNECTNVPRLWANLTQSVDTHGSCMQFYDRKNCKGRIAVIQPFHTVHQMDLSLINFHNTIESLSPCGAKGINVHIYIYVGNCIIFTSKYVYSSVWTLCNSKCSRCIGNKFIDKI